MFIESRGELVGEIRVGDAVDFNVAWVGMTSSEEEEQRETTSMSPAKRGLESRAKTIEEPRLPKTWRVSR